jgi:hypothetical protein
MKLVVMLLPVFAVGLAAQPVTQAVAPSPNVFFKSAVMGPTVKGAPYSATETVENTQTLSDGTHIDHTTQTMVYRDSEGRMRRETSDSVTIWDPVANTSYVLNPKTQTVVQMPLGMARVGASVVTTQGGSGQVMRFEYHGPAPAEAQVIAGPVPPDAGPIAMLAPPGTPLPELMNLKQVKLDAQTQSLGHQTMEGLDTEGTRITSTIEAGAIGNDRPIQIVTERWYSSDLQTNVKVTHSDPRTGQETTQITGVSRSEPAPYLFQVPAGYQLVNGK